MKGSICTCSGCKPFYNGYGGCCPPQREPSVSNTQCMWSGQTLWVVASDKLIRSFLKVKICSYRSDKYSSSVFKL